MEKRTIAKMIFCFEGKEYPYEYDFGYGFPKESAEYMFMDGNYSCDCNRSIFIRELHPQFKEMDCGCKIKLEKFKIFQCIN